MSPFLLASTGEVVIPAVLDALKVNLIVGLGEGAGANVLVRFALSHTSRVLGSFIPFSSQILQTYNYGSSV